MWPFNVSWLDIKMLVYTIVGVYYCVCILLCVYTIVGVYYCWCILLLVYTIVGVYYCVCILLCVDSGLPGFQLVCEGLETGLGHIKLCRATTTLFHLKH